jgi:3-dehydroquinate synthase
MNIHVSMDSNSYDIMIERGILRRAGELLDLKRKALIVTDTGVPEKYAETVCAQCRNGYIITVQQGEQSKSLQTFEQLLSKMLELGFTRKDCVIAVGGGVVGDLAGFTAASYMRGIDFYNIPTTVLSQVDSSVGGKTAVNLNGVKNIVGAFYQPKRVLIDPDVLFTLPKRQISSGLAEALKMSLTSDAALFRLFENEDPVAHIEDIIIRSVQIKKEVVEQDEKESGLRRILNFGHTVGHAIESEEALSGLFHGECVALGMLPMITDPALRDRVKIIYRKLDLPCSISFDPAVAMQALTHDKKSFAKGIQVTTVDHPGSYKTASLQPEEFIELFEIIKEG